MLRKIVVVFGFATVLPCVPWLSGAAQAQIDVSGNTVTCNTLHKTALKASPPLILGGTQPTTLKLKGKLAGCTSNAGGFLIPDDKSTLGAALALPTNDCAGLVTGLAASGSILIKWKATEKITPTASTVLVDDSDLTAGLYSSPWGASYGYLGLGINDRPSGTAGTPLAVQGAFTGGDGGVTSTADFISQEDVTTLINACLGGLPIKALNVGLSQINLQ